MDKNKLQVLNHIEYRIMRVCASCVHGDFNDRSSFGYCDEWTYEHEKHGETRFLSVHVHGHCRMWKGRQDDEKENFKKYLRSENECLDQE